MRSTQSVLGTRRKQVSVWLFHSTGLPVIDLKYCQDGEKKEEGSKTVVLVSSYVIMVRYN